MAEMHPQRGAVGVLVKTYPKLSETFILEELLGLERLGTKLQVFALQRPTDAVMHGDVARVRAPVSYLPDLRPGNFLQLAGAHLGLLLQRPLRYLNGLGAALTRRGGLADFLPAGWLAHYMARHRIAHLHTHFISRPADIGELVGALGFRFSISAHAKDIYLSSPVALRRKLAAARFTVTCTEYNRRTLAALSGGAPVHRMYHGVDAGQFHPDRRAPADHPPLILAVGRLREKKGFDTLIEACRELRLRGLEFRCEIVGYGETAEQLTRLIAQHDLADHITLAGVLPRPQVIARYGRCSVFVQPSRIGSDGDRDGIPNVVLEAMAMELPVVATRVSGIPEVVVHEATGLLVEAERPEQLADAIARVLADPALGRRLGSAARHRVCESFDNDRNLNLLKGLLEDPDERTHRAAVQPSPDGTPGLL